MIRNWLVAAFIVFSLTSFVRADEKYVLKEKVDVGRVTKFEVIYDRSEKSDTTEDGKLAEDEHVDTKTHQVIKGTATVLEVKDGSATAMRVVIDPASGTTITEKNQKPTTAPSPFAGKTIEIRRQADGSVASDFKGNATKDDLHDLGSVLDPDEDNFPDHPVAVGDSWEISDKLSKRIDLGPKDQVLANCELDSVKTEDGKQIATIAVSAAFVTFEDRFIENDIELSGTLKVDLATGLILRGDLKGPVKISGSNTFPKAGGGAEKVEVSGTGEVVTSSDNAPATRPSK